VQRQLTPAIAARVFPKSAGIPEANMDDDWQKRVGFGKRDRARAGIERFIAV